MPVLNIRRPQNALFLTAALFSACWVGTSPLIVTPFEIPRLALLAVLLFAIRFFFMKRVASPTSSGSIVMAIGIFINGAIIRVPYFDRQLAPHLTLALLIILLFIAGSYIAEALHGDFFKQHLENHVGRFATGTWIAAISVCTIAICQRLPQWKLLAQVLVIGNIVLWVFFIILAIAGLRQIHLSGAQLEVHGVLLLSTVSTQSLVNAWKAAFNTGRLYGCIAPWVILFGSLLYCVGLYLILRYYLYRGRSIDLDKNWFNTNCIIHGAMSITGLACAVSGTVPADLILLAWLWALSWFVIIESVEIARAAKRIILYGPVRAILVYNPTQWSRNFTFGMFYSFTLNFDISASRAAGTFLAVIHQSVVNYFGWLVLILLLLEIFIFFRDRLSLTGLATTSA